MRARSEWGARYAMTPLLAPLSPRQREAVSWLAHGLGDREIGIAMGIATDTARKHISRAVERLQVETRPQLAALVAFDAIAAGQPLAEAVEAVCGPRCAALLTQ